jgi:hypothetical protein
MNKRFLSGRMWQSTAMMSVVIMLGVMCSLAWSQSSEKKVTIKNVPAPVKEAILKAVGKGKLVDIGEFIEDGKVVHYEIEMIVDGEEYDILFAPDGKVLSKVHEGTAGAKKAQLDEAEFFIEYNASDKDAGVQVFLDGEGWDWLEIYNPAGKKIYRFNVDNDAKKIGMTELFFESSEPSFDALPFADLLKLYPEGEYEFSGQMINGDKFESKTKFTHMVPAAPVVSPKAHSVVDPKNTVISWKPVTKPKGINIVSYQVIVERNDPLRVLDVTLPPTARKIQIPAEFLEYDTPYQFEVLAKEESRNQTISIGFFKTSKK